MAVAGGPFLHSKAQVGGNQRLHAVEEEIVKLGTGLPADLNGVFKARGCDQRHARAFALQQRVRAHCRAMQQDHRSPLPDLFQRLDDGLRRVRRRGKNLEHANLAAFHPYAVSEGAAGVDGDVKR